MRVLVISLLFVASNASADKPKWETPCRDQLKKAQKEAGGKTKGEIASRSTGLKIGSCGKKQKSCLAITVGPHNPGTGTAPPEAWEVEKTDDNFSTERSHEGFVARIEAHGMQGDAIMKIVQAFRPALDQCLVAPR